MKKGIFMFLLLFSVIDSFAYTAEKPDYAMVLLDDSQVSNLSDLELLGKWANFKLKTMISFKSHKCDCNDSSKPWERDIGKGCKDYAASLSQSLFSSDKLVNEWNKRSISKEKRDQIIESIRKKWLENFKETESESRDAILTQLRNSDKLESITGVTMFYFMFHSKDAESDLDEIGFDSMGIKYIEDAIGIAFPKDAKGLRFHYIPPVDPIIFAKILIPPHALTLMNEQFLKVKPYSPFPEDFANARCHWWPTKIKNPEFLVKGTIKGYFIEMYLVHEIEQLILYLKYFTI